MSDQFTNASDIASNTIAGAGSVLVFASSPASLVLGCGGAVALHCEAADSVQVIVACIASSTAPSCDDGRIAALQPTKLEAAARVLGHARSELWQLPESDLQFDENLIQRVLSRIQKSGARLIYGPYSDEPEAGHRALFLCIAEAARRLGGSSELMLYESGHALSRPNFFVDITSVFPRKLAAVDYVKSSPYRNQYAKLLEGLSQYRASVMQRGVEHAEAYRRCSFDETGALLMLSSLPDESSPQPAGDMQPPLVSIIVRSMGRRTLAETLRSIAAQTYPNIEVIVVNALGAGHQLLPNSCGRFPLISVSGNGILDRSTAANMGLEATRGAYVGFLDDDDLFYPTHVTVLVDNLSRRPGARIAYNGIRVEHFNKKGELANVSLLNEPFDVRRLRIQNYLPIHSVLFERSLFAEGARFDEKVDLYEDWDFWLQLSTAQHFAATGHVGGIYRNFGGSGITKHPGDQSRRLREKWLERWSIKEIADLFDYFLSDDSPWAHHWRNEALAEARERVNSIAADKALLQARLSELEGLDKSQKTTIEELRQKISESAERERASIEREEAAQEKLADQIRRGDGLETQIAFLYASTSWRITAPLRGLKHFGHWLSGLSHHLDNHGGGASGLSHMSARFLRGVRRYGILEALRRSSTLLKASNNRQLVSANTARVELERSPPRKIHPHECSVDIIVCVHDALEDVRRCLDSVIAHTNRPYRLILVDDGSSLEAAAYLREFSLSNNANLLRSEEATGYTSAANRGMRAATGEYLVLLNSDTIVSHGWLDRLVACAQSSDRIAMVGPLSNTASWQSIPQIETEGDWAENRLPINVDIPLMARMIAEDSAQFYPRLPFLNGFCLLIKREVVRQIGYFNENRFSSGYGEENDLSIRLSDAGYELAVADDTYVYHAQSRSYSHERRKVLAKRAGQILEELHSQERVQAGVRACRSDRTLEGIRSRTAHLHERREQVENACNRWAGKRILFVLPTTDAGGGANVITTEARAMRRMGVDAQIANLSANRKAFELNYADLGLPVVYFDQPKDIADIASQYDAAIASIYYTVPWLQPLQRHPKTTLGYYIQDFEPLFFERQNREYSRALSSYSLIGSMRRFCKTDWNRDVLRRETGVDCAVVGASVDVDRFRPCTRAGMDPMTLTVAAMIRPNSPYRAPELTVQLLRATKRRYGNACRLMTFGVEAEDPAFQALRIDFPLEHYGKLPPSKLAALLSHAHVFADFSKHQAMGLTAMEAMACRAAVIVPEAGGACTFARHMQNSLLVDTADHEACQGALDKLVGNPSLADRLGRQALKDIQQFFPERAASKILDVMLRN